jgi:REP element-mobilizing transposase RayT
VTKRINEVRQTPAQPVWQRGYYDHVVRDEDELNRIREYVSANPERWPFDPEEPSAIAVDDEPETWDL